MKATFRGTKDETICFHMLLFADGPDDTLLQRNIKNE